MVYQSHLTKFMVLKPLEFKRVKEVAHNLIDIFTLLGAPSVLQSDNGREFANQIVSNLKILWPELKIVHGKPRHSQSQGSVERANQDVKNMLATWMEEKKCSNWSQGLRFIQLMKNRVYHSGIKCSPYEALFGCKAKVGLSTSNLPKEVIEVIENEEELENIMNAESTVNCNEKQVDIDVEKTYNDEQIATKNENAVQLRQKAVENLEIQAQRMLNLYTKKFPPAPIDTIVRVPVPDVNIECGDARNILAIVLEETKDEFYRLGTRDSVLNQLYARWQLIICKTNLLHLYEIPLEKEMALRSIMTKQSTGSGQGFI